ncbi:MAG: DUF3570 domain-containing protein [Deltaproteobacteria bacterium]|nr:DUF3570 domain-containing protein [Deltaproteobacteria bacterium]
MRLQLVAAALLVSTTAFADGNLSMRGVYYKERSTRVMQPMLDGMFEVGSRGLVTAHVLVDAITSASAGSGAVMQKPFTEQRYEGGIGYTHELDGPSGSILDRIRLGGDAKLSDESDYRSIYGGVRTEADLAHRNATVGAGGGLSVDKVDASGSQGPLGGIALLCEGNASATSTSCPLDVYNAYIKASQITGEDTVVGANYELAYLDGFQSNAYRQVPIPVLGTYVPERHPFTRTRQAAAASIRHYFRESETTVVAAYRFYWDDWHIHAHTPELRIIQDVGRHADASFMYRYYRQTAAYFWRPFYPDPMTLSHPYVTDDPKMSPFDGHTLEAKLGVFGEAFDLSGRWAGARFEGILEYVIQHNRFGNAVVAHVALTLPLEY